MLDLIPVVGSTLSKLALGGDHIDGRTIVRFTTFHTTMLPLLIAGLAAWHFWRVRRAGGVVVPPDADTTERTTFFPHLFVRELAQASLLLAVVVVLSAALGAPLGDPANSGLSPNPVKAPWYFVGWQELLIHVHPLLALLLVPLILLFSAIALPRLAEGPTPAGRWFLGQGAPIFAASIASALLTFGLVLISDRLGGARSEWMAGLLLPVLVLAALFGAGILLLRRWMRPPADVLALAAAGALISAGIVLGLVGQFLRGQDMALIWPG
jgi:quinol-cytochrome oxidoreductase complex cytochrome b subunit